MDRATQRLLAVIRIGLGWTFFWAFIDKLFGLGFATAREAAWLVGGSPTEGFLSFATAGPLAPLYQSLAGNPIIDGLFMFGLLGLGLALLLGIGMRVASVAGPLLMVLMWSAHLPPANNPLIDQHILYGFMIIVLARLKAGRTWGLGRRWSAVVGETMPILE